MSARHLALLLVGPTFLLVRILWGVWTHPVPAASQWLLTLTVIALVIALARICHARTRRN